MKETEARVTLKFERNQNPTIKLIWQTILALILFYGILLSYMQCIELQRTQKVILFLAGCAMIFLCVSLSSFSKQRKWYSWVPAGIGILMGIAGGPVNIFQGFLGILNYYIGWWNLKYQSGVSLISADITESDIFRCSVLLMVLFSALCWYLIKTEKMLILFVVSAVFWIEGLLLNRFSQWSCVFIFTGTFGGYLAKLKSAGIKRRIFWTLAVGVFLTAFAISGGAKTVQAVTDVRNDVKQKIHVWRYGEDTLPDGDLHQAYQMQKGEEERLVVTSDQAKILYLRGFVGQRYDSGVWKTAKKSLYSDEWRGLFEWMNENEILPYNQYSSYLNAEDENQIKENTITVDNIGAKRKYVYVPYSTEMILDNLISEDEDGAVVSSGFFGTKSYKLKEYSKNEPTELLTLGNWYFNAQTKAQETYVENEKVYRNFVYENYLTVDENLKDFIDEIFWSNVQEKPTGIYAVTQHIRSVLNEKVSYNEAPDKIPAEEEPILWFFQTGNGNSALYASTAVEVFRSEGIPARYAEGYYLDNTETKQRETTLNSKDSHAWAEVYMDGIGWIPVDVTPGYYFDTYALMEMVEQPQEVQDTTSLDDNTNSSKSLSKKSDETLDGRNKKIKRQHILLRLFESLFLCLAVVVTFFVIVRYTKGYRALIWLKIHMRNVKKEERTAALIKLIPAQMAYKGIPAEIGWKAEEIDKRLCEEFEGFEFGEYVRVNQLMEKFIYGEVPLKPHEERVLMVFFEKMYEQKAKKKENRIKERLKRWHPFGFCLLLPYVLYAFCTSLNLWERL